MTHFPVPARVHRLALSLAGCLALVAGALLSGCGLGRDPLVGDWRGETARETILLTFRQDGTFALIDADGVNTTEIYGRWAKANPTTIALTAYGASDSFDLSVLSVGNGEMSLRSPSMGERILSFKRVSDSPQVPSPAEHYAASPAAIGAMAERSAAKRIDLKVLNNARMLSAAADQYFLEYETTIVGLNQLVGPDKYIRAMQVIAGETYPTQYTLGMPITVTVHGVAGLRTITYAP